MRTQKNQAVRKFRITFYVEVNAGSLLTDDQEAASQVEELAGRIWDGEADPEERANFVDSYNFEAQEEVC